MENELKNNYMTEDIRLLHGDCIEVMQGLISKGIKVDLTVTSPPYDNLRTYNGTCEWNFNVFQQVAQCLYDITTDGGVVVWVVGDATINGSETGTSFRQALYFKEIGFNLHDTMIWEKKNPIPNDTRQNRYRQTFEYMFVFSKGKPKFCNYIREICKCAGHSTAKKGSQRKSDGTKRMDIEKRRSQLFVQDTKTRTNIWVYTVGSSKEHPAVFPEQLANDHIISWSNEGDLVLDCFMGSGTTGKMALLNNRRFIGIEKVDEYFDIATKRIEGARINKQLKLF